MQNHRNRKSVRRAIWQPYLAHLRSVHGDILFYPDFIHSKVSEKRAAKLLDAQFYLFQCVKHQILVPFKSYLRGHTWYTY